MATASPSAALSASRNAARITWVGEPGALSTEILRSRSAARAGPAAGARTRPATTASASLRIPDDPFFLPPGARPARSVAGDRRDRALCEILAGDRRHLVPDRPRLLLEGRPVDLVELHVLLQLVAQLRRGL